VTLAKQASGTANTLQGFNGSGAASEVTVGSGLTLTGGTLTASASGNTFTRATLTATAMSVDMEYSGTVPVLALASSVYSLTIPASTTWKSAVLTGNASSLSGSNFTLDIVSTDGNSDYYTFKILNEDDGSIIRLADYGIQVQTSVPAAGTVRYVFSNMSGLASGWKIIATR